MILSKNEFNNVDVSISMQREVINPIIEEIVDIVLTRALDGITSTYITIEDINCMCDYVMIKGDYSISHDNKFRKCIKKNLVKVLPEYRVRWRLDVDSSPAYYIYIVNKKHCKDRCAIN